LLMQSGTYRRIHDLQFSDEELNSMGSGEVAPAAAELEGTA